MKALLAIVYTLVLIMVQIKAEDTKHSNSEEDTIKVYKRLIPADVLRGIYFILFSEIFTFLDFK